MQERRTRRLFLGITCRALAFTVFPLFIHPYIVSIFLRFFFILGERHSFLSGKRRRILSTSCSTMVLCPSPGSYTRARSQSISLFLFFFLFIDVSQLLHSHSRLLFPLRNDRWKSRLGMFFLPVLHVSYTPCLGEKEKRRSRSCLFLSPACSLVFLTKESFS